MTKGELGTSGRQRYRCALDEGADEDFEREVSSPDPSGAAERFCESLHEGGDLELNDAPFHVLVDDRMYLVDFEPSFIARRVTR